MKRYVSWGATVLLTVCAILVVYDTFFSTGTLIYYVKELLDVLMPVLYGVFIAYLLSPMINSIERVILQPIFKNREKKGLIDKPMRCISILIAMAVVLLACYLLIHILVPELVNSAVTLANNAETYYRTVYHWINRLLEDNPSLERTVLTLLDEYFGDLQSWVTRLMPQAQQILAAVTDGIWSVVIFAKNLLIGLIVSIYLLFTKETCLASSRRIVCALFKDSSSRLILHCAERTNAIFSGFIRGKLLDSLIIGLLCYLGTSILNMPYAPLVSLIVGVTNVIPFFGPFLGAVPSAFLILLVSPLKCLYFILFVFLLQQFDGNILGPKILGDSTGISSFWVIVAILVGGGFFGVAGMFFGVPVFASCYAGVQTYVDYRLRSSGKSTAIEDYAKDSCGTSAKPKDPQ